jgi:hypothetical protein
MQRVHRFYKHDNANLGGACVYCGKRASSVDHVPPVSFACYMKIDELKSIEPKLFPACHHCNNILGVSLEMSLVDRRNIVARHLEIKKKRTLARGREIYDKKLPTLGDFREQLCLLVYERWLFASVTTNEASKELEPEEEYTREDFRKVLDKPGISTSLRMASWGISTEITNDLVVDHSFEFLKDKGLSPDEIARYKIARNFPNMRGPFGWSSTMDAYKKLVETTITCESLDAFYAELRVVAPFVEVSSTAQTLLVTPINRSNFEIPVGFKLSDLEFINPSSLTEEDLKKNVSGFVGMKLTEVNFALDRLKQLSKSQARDACIAGIKPFLKQSDFQFLTSDDGTRFFLALIFSVNCPLLKRREILAQLIRAQR